MSQNCFIIVIDRWTNEVTHGPQDTGTRDVMPPPPSSINWSAGLGVRDATTRTEYRKRYFRAHNTRITLKRDLAIAARECRAHTRTRAAAESMRTLAWGSSCKGQEGGASTPPPQRQHEYGTTYTLQVTPDLPNVQAEPKPVAIERRALWVGLLEGEQVQLPSHLKAHVAQQPPFPHSLHGPLRVVAKLHAGLGVRHHHLTADLDTTPMITLANQNLGCQRRSGAELAGVGQEQHRLCLAHRNGGHRGSCHPVALLPDSRRRVLNPAQHKTHTPTPFRTPTFKAGHGHQTEKNKTPSKQRPQSIGRGGRDGEAIRTTGESCGHSGRRQRISHRPRTGSASPASSQTHQRGCTCPDHGTRTGHALLQRMCPHGT